MDKASNKRTHGLLGEHQCWAVHEHLDYCPTGVDCHDTVEEIDLHAVWTLDRLHGIEALIEQGKSPRPVQGIHLRLSRRNGGIYGHDVHHAASVPGRRVLRGRAPRTARSQARVMCGGRH